MSRSDHQRSTLPASPDDIDITQLGRSVGRSLKFILLATLLAGGASFAVLSLMTPKYAAEATVEIVNEDTAASRGTGGNELSRPDLDTVRTQARVLQSRDLAAKVATELKLNAVPEFSQPFGGDGMLGLLASLAGLGPAPHETLEQRVLGAYFKNLQVTPFKESRIIGIEAKSADPALAAEIANTLVRNYREELRAKRLEAETEPAPSLDKQIAKLAAEIQLLEAEAERERNKLREVRIATPSAGGADSTLNTQQLQELNTKLNDAKSQRSEAEARARIIRDMLQRSGQVDASPDVLKAPLMQQLQVQKARIDRQLAELSATLLPAHPRMQQMRAEQAGFHKQMREEAQKIVLSLENEAKIAGAREAGLKAELDGMVRRRADDSQDTSRLRQLDADLTGKREILSGYKKRQEDVRVRGAGRITPITVRVIQQAVPSAEPVSPKKGYALLVMAATFLGGLALSVSKGLLVGARSGERSHGPASPHARMPRIEPAALAGTNAVAAKVSARRSPPTALASVDAVCERLRGRDNGQSGFRTLVTGEDDAIDASSEAVEIARKLAAGGKRVILVDWSAAAKPITANLPIARTPGIRELIANEVAFDAVVHTVGEAGLHVIAPGKPRTSSEGPDEIEGIHLVFEALDEIYDHVMVTAEQAVARRLFGLLDGGFDAGVLVGRAVVGAASGSSEPGFLGFAAPELELIRLVQSAPSPGISARLGRQPGERSKMSA